MSLLRDIQNAAVDKNTEVSTLLRQCKILAARLGNDAFKRWVDNELNGYKSKDELPEYRILTVNSYGHFSGPVGSGLKNAPIPLTCIPKEFRENMRHSYLMSPISSYAALIEGKDRSNAQEPWPADFVAHFGSDIYEDMSCLAAWKVIPRNALVALIDTVKTRILSFALEIEGEAPDAGEAPPNTIPVPQEKVTQVFNTFISGNVQNVATGSSHFSQSGDFSIAQGDFNSLKKYLTSKGIKNDDIDELKLALEEDASEGQVVSFGNKVTAWMAKMLRKAATGAWEVTTEVAGSVIGKALSKYYGLD